MYGVRHCFVKIKLAGNLLYLVLYADTAKELRKRGNVVRMWPVGFKSYTQPNIFNFQDLWVHVSELHKILRYVDFEVLKL